MASRLHRVMVNHKARNPEALTGWAWLSTTPLGIEVAVTEPCYATLVGPGHADKVDEPSHA